MLRRGVFCLARFASAAEALSYLQTPGQGVTLDAALDVLATHATAQEDIARATLEHVVALDVDDAATVAIAPHRPHLLEVARAYPAAAGERVCRCVANLCTVPDAAASDEENADAPAGVVTLATQLQRDGAVQLVLSVMERGEALSAKGRAWTAMALLNLCMFDDAAAREAAKAGAVTTAARVLRLALEATEGVAAADVSPVELAAVDAALGVIPRLLSLQVEDNAETAHYYQRVPLAVVEAVAAAANADVGLTVEHKAWEAIRLIAAEPTNHAMLFNALHATDRAAGTRVLKGWMERSSEGLRTMQPHTTNPDVAHEQTLRRNVLLAGLEALTAITSAAVEARQDAAAVRNPEEHGEATTERVGSEAPSFQNEGDADEDVVSFSASGIEDDVAPSATSALAALSSGTLSRFAVSTLASTPADILAPRSSDHATGRDDSLVLGCANLLVNLAESDPYVTSANCLAPVLPLLDPLREPKLSAPVTERFLTLLWNVLNHSAGADAVATLEVAKPVKRLSVDPNAAESTRVLAGRLLQKLDAILENPRYARDKRGGGSEAAAE